MDLLPMAPSSGPAQPQKKLRLAYIVSHPIQYQAPLLRRIALEQDIDLTVMFGSDFSLRAYKDDGFGVAIQWDIPLLEGYRSEVLPNLRDAGGFTSFTSPISRGIFTRLLGSPIDGPAYDAVWVHGYASINSLQTILAAYSLGIPVLLRADIWLADRARSSFKLAIKSLFLKTLSKLITATLPVGSLNAAYWSHYFGRNFPQFLMPYAIDNSYFTFRAAEAAATEQSLRGELNLVSGRPIILFASKLQTRKHCDHLVQAYRELLLTSTTPPYLIIVGDGEEREALGKQCREAGLDGVRFAGFQNQSQMPRYLQLADVFVLPARHEPWGLIVNEAMAAGCPVIVSSDVGAGPDLITDGVEGYIYPVGDIPALTTALNLVLASPETSAHMGQAARTRIDKWSFDENIQSLRQALAFCTHKLRP